MHKPNLPRGLDPRRKQGLNYRMSELTAAVGLAQLNKIDFILDKAKENKKFIKDGMKNTSNIRFRENTLMSKERKEIQLYLVLKLVRKQNYLKNQLLTMVLERKYYLKLLNGIMLVLGIIS